MQSLMAERSFLIVVAIVGVLILMRLIVGFSSAGSPLSQFILLFWPHEATEGETPDQEAVRRATLQNMDGTLLALAVVFLVVRPFVVSAFYIPSGSMQPTLMGNPQRNDRVLVCRYLYHLREPRRGEIAVFKPPQAAFGPGEPRVDFIKRIIAVPGDVVQVRNGYLYLNGVQQWEGYVMPNARTLTPAEQTGYVGFRSEVDFSVPQQVPAGHYVMMGDNREQSGDSRVWGYVSRDSILGRAIFVFWPLFDVHYEGEDGPGGVPFRRVTPWWRGGDVDHIEWVARPLTNPLAVAPADR